GDPSCRSRRARSGRRGFARWRHRRQRSLSHARARCAGAPHRHLLRCPHAGGTALRQCWGRGGRRPGDRPHRGDEAVQRDQERRRRTGPTGRRGEWPAGQGKRPAHRSRAERVRTGTREVARMQPRSARITGWGMYAPEGVLTNADLERMVDTSDEWILTRTGIRERRIAAPHETTATMGAIAAKRAIATAGLAADDIDMILLATCTPDYQLPSTAAFVKDAWG